MEHQNGEQKSAAAEALALASQMVRTMRAADVTVPSTSTRQSNNPVPSGSGVEDTQLDRASHPSRSPSQPFRNRAGDQAVTQEAHKRASFTQMIEIAELWVVDGARWPVAARALFLTLPPRRQVKKNNNPFRPVPEEWNITAAVGQCVGEPAPTPCRPCRTRKVAPFTGGCVVLTPKQERDVWVAGDGRRVQLRRPRCCFNCRYQWQYAHCKWDEPVADDDDDNDDDDDGVGGGGGGGGRRGEVVGGGTV